MASNSAIENTGAETRQRCKHDIDMVNRVNERLFKMKAVLDLLLCCRSEDLDVSTLGNLGWLLTDIIDETKAIVCESEEVPA